MARKRTAKKLGKNTRRLTRTLGTPVDDVLLLAAPGSVPWVVAAALTRVVGSARERGCEGCVDVALVDCWRVVALRSRVRDAAGAEDLELDMSGFAREPAPVDDALAPGRVWVVTLP